MGKTEMKKDIKNTLGQSIDSIGNATKQSTENIIEVAMKHGVEIIMEYFDKGIGKIKEKLEEGTTDGKSE
jgi:hypothetical protein